MGAATRPLPTPSIDMVVGIDFDADIARAVSDLPGSMTWEGDAYACVINAIPNREVISIEGVHESIDFVIVIQTSLFSSTRPTVGDVITVGGVEYRLVGVETDEADAGLNLFIKEFTG